MKSNRISEDFLLEQRVRFCELFDTYGSILTEKQRATCELMLRDDLSMSELAAELGVTRQAAYDLVRRTRDLLENMESKLRLDALQGRMDRLAEIIKNNESALPKDFLESVSRIMAD